MLKFERDLQKRIEEHDRQLRETRRTLGLTPENIQSVVEIALSIARQPPLRPAQVDGIPAGEAFHLPALSGSWAAAATGLAHPHTGEMRPLVFDHNLAKRRDDVVLAHLNHRLVQMSLRLLREEVWSPAGSRGLNRVTARQVPDAALDTPAVIAHARLVVIGGDGGRLHEEIITAGGFIRQGRFRRFDTVGEMDAILAAGTDKPIPESMQQRLAAIWPEFREQVERSLEVRQENLVNGMKRQLRERAEKEQRDIEAILNELAQAIEREIGESSGYRQLELFSDNERSQLTRNIEALEARLEEIPNEIEAEQEAIRTRFADLQPRLFPVALTFFIPERLI
jgi:hypothetical protein